MKITVKQILDAARDEIGYKESPAGSNRTKYGKWYGLDGQPWCAMFIMWLFWKLNATDMLPGKTPSCGQFRTMAKEARNWHTSDYRPGDIVVMTFSVLRIPQHIGIVESVKPDGSLVTIEGNTAVGNNSNGGEVMRRNRKKSCILGAFSPAYREENTKKSIYLVAQEALNGKWGSGAERKAKLAEAGYDAATVQKLVNLLVKDGIPATVKVNSYLSVRNAASSAGKELFRWQNGRKVKITEVKDGQGASAWGRVPGAGWISFDYVTVEV